MERSSSGDSLHGVVLRYLPGWDAPYRLVVSSEERGATGPFALDALAITVRDLGAEGSQQGLLGDQSWLDGGRYLDTYRFRARDGSETAVEVQSDAFAPALRVWRAERRSRAEVAEVANPGGAASATYQAELDAGDYFLEVTSGGPDSLYTGGRRPGGDYTVVLKSESLEPPAALARPPPTDRRPEREPDLRHRGPPDGPERREHVRGGRHQRRHLVPRQHPDSRSAQRHRPLGRLRRRLGAVVQLRQPVLRRRRPGPAATRPSVAESQSPSGLRAEPGTARRGTVVFYLPEVAPDLRRVVLVASIGERTVTLPIPVP